MGEPPLCPFAAHLFFSFEHEAEGGGFLAVRTHTRARTAKKSLSINKKKPLKKKAFFLRARRGGGRTARNPHTYATARKR